MKANALTQILLMAAALSISGCYTQFSAPIARQEFYEQSESDTVYQEEEAYENYAFDSSSLSEYRLGYRDGYYDSMNSNLWYGYNAYSPFYHSYRYHSPFLGYYDPWFYDPFYSWNYYSYDPWYYGYNPYYSYYGYYGGYYGHYYHGGYWGRPFHYYGGGEVVASGREQHKADYLPKSNVSGSRSSANNSDFQSGASYLPIAVGAASSASTANKTNATVVKGSRSTQTSTIDKTFSSKSSDSESIIGFQTTLVPASNPKTVITRTVSGSRSTSRSSAAQKSGSSSTTLKKKSASHSGSSSSSYSGSSSSSYKSSSSSSSSGSSSSPSSSGSQSSSSSSGSSSGRSSHKASGSSSKKK